MRPHQTAPSAKHTPPIRELPAASVLPYTLPCLANIIHFFIEWTGGARNKIVCVYARAFSQCVYRPPQGNRRDVYGTCTIHAPESWCGVWMTYLSIPSVHCSAPRAQTNVSLAFLGQLFFGHSAGSRVALLVSSPPLCCLLPLPWARWLSDSLTPPNHRFWPNRLVTI